MFRCSTENGRVDILHEVSMLSQYMVVPRKGHMKQLLHIVGCIEKKMKFVLHMDPTFPYTDYNVFMAKKEDFSEYYRDAEEEKPCNVPRPRGQ